MFSHYLVFDFEKENLLAFQNLALKKTHLKKVNNPDKKCKILFRAILLIKVHHTPLKLDSNKISWKLNNR